MRLVHAAFAQVRSACSQYTKNGSLAHRRLHICFTQQRTVHMGRENQGSWWLATGFRYHRPIDMPSPATPGIFHRRLTFPLSTPSAADPQTRSPHYWPRSSPKATSTRQLVPARIQGCSEGDKDLEREETHLEVDLQNPSACDPCRRYPETRSTLRRYGTHLESSLEGASVPYRNTVCTVEWYQNA